MSLPIAKAAPASLTRRLLVAQESGLVLVIVLLMAALTILGGTKQARIQDPATQEWKKVEVNKFLDAQNLVLLAKDASFIALMAVGMTAVIVMGGIDLSVGSIYALAAVLGAMALRALQAQWLGVPYAELATSEGGPGVLLSVAVGLAVCCGIGAACGAANGAMVVGLRVHPFIITLGMMAVLRGIVFVLTQGQSIFNFPESFTTGFFKLELARVWHADFGKGLYPMPVLVMLVVMAVGIVILGRTVLGRRTYAIGGNETAARYAGVPVGRVKIIVYTIMGALAGLSACVYLGYLGAAEPNAGNGYELRVIAASVIGGASLSGGRGSALGAVLGAILIQLISNAMLILEIDQAYTDIVMGAAIVVAVVLDQFKARLTPGR
ncbi:MAG: ABC transporter permease [Phycisphaerales bacterium]|nr:ABC transporter permease [Phycisphaerales bacterium]